MLGPFSSRLWSVIVKICRTKKPRPALCHIKKVAFWNILRSMCATFNSFGKFFKSALISTRRDLSNKKDHTPIGAILRKLLSWTANNNRGSYPERCQLGDINYQLSEASKIFDSNLLNGHSEINSFWSDDNRVSIQNRSSIDALVSEKQWRLHGLYTHERTDGHRPTSSSTRHRTLDEKTDFSGKKIKEIFFRYVRTRNA